MPTWLHTALVIFAGGALTAVSDALVNGFTADAVGMKRVAVAGVAGGMVALVAWLKQSPIKPGEPTPKAAAVAALLCFCLMSSACATGSGQFAINPRGQKGVDQHVVEQLICNGQEDLVAVYVSDRGGSRADTTEAIARAKEAVAKRSACKGAAPSTSLLSLPQSDEPQPQLYLGPTERAVSRVQAENGGVR